MLPYFPKYLYFSHNDECHILHYFHNIDCCRFFKNIYISIILMAATLPYLAEYLKYIDDFHSFQNINIWAKMMTAIFYNISTILTAAVSSKISIFQSYWWLPHSVKLPYLVEYFKYIDDFHSFQNINICAIMMTAIFDNISTILTAAVSSKISIFQGCSCKVRSDGRRGNSD